VIGKQGRQPCAAGLEARRAVGGVSISTGWGAASGGSRAERLWSRKAMVSGSRAVAGGPEHSISEW